jgi:TPR repeat protein
VAREWHRRAAAAGDTASAHDLGFLAYAAGEDEETVHWWESAARGGHVESAHCMGLYLDAERDPEGAEAYYRLAARSEHPGAASWLGGIALSRGDLRTARAWYERAANAGRAEDQRMAGFVCVELGDTASAGHWFGRAAAGGDAEAAFTYGLLLIAEFGDLAGGRHWFRQAAQAGHREAAVELGGLLTASGEQVEAHQWLSDPPPPVWARPAEPELAARAELAALTTGRRGGEALDAAELTEILATWDLMTRPLHDHSDVVSWLVRRTAAHRSSIEHLASVRGTLLRPGAAPWPSPAEVQHVLATARDLRGRLGLE